MKTKNKTQEMPPKPDYVGTDEYKKFLLDTQKHIHQAQLELLEEVIDTYVTVFPPKEDSTLKADMAGYALEGGDHRNDG